MNETQLKKAIAFELGRKTVAEQNKSSLKTEKKHQHGKHPNWVIISILYLTLPMVIN